MPYNFIFKLADSKGDDTKTIVQVVADDLASAKTKIDTDFTPFRFGTLISAQEIKELDPDNE